MKGSWNKVVRLREEDDNNAATEHDGMYLQSFCQEK